MTGTSSPIESTDTPRRHGRLLRMLMQCVKALQDARQREADQLVANYEELRRKVGHKAPARF